MNEPSRHHVTQPPPPSDGRRRSLAPDGVAVTDSAVFGVRPAEQVRTALLAAMLFVCSCVFVLGRTVRDALFLSYFRERTADVLPWMFIAFGVSSALVAGPFARASARLARAPFVSAYAAFVSVSYVSAWVALQWSPGWLYPVLYVGSEIAGNLLIAMFWAVANDLHDPRSAKRLFGVIGLGRIIGVVACGLGAGSFVAAVGTDNLLLVLAALSASIVPLVLWLVKDFGLSTRPPMAGRRESLGVLAPLRSRYVRSVAILLLLGFVAVNVGDFQFKAAARLAHPDRDDLALFMARYYASMGAVALVLQLLVTRPLLRRFGVGGGLLVLPIAYGLANLVLLLSPGIFGATLVKISDNAVQFTVFEATLQLLYFPLDGAERDGARATLEAAVKPLGYALAGAAVLGLGLLFPAVSMRAIALQSWFVLPLLALSIVASRIVRRDYVGTLERSLRRRTAEVEEAPLDEASTQAALVRGAMDTAPRIACFAIDRLTEVAPSIAIERVPEWLERPAPEVRIAAIRAAERLRLVSHLPDLERAMDDREPLVAAASIAAFASLSGERCLDVVQPRLDDPRPVVEEAAVAALLRDGGLEGILAAGARIHAWMRSGRANDRTRAANTLGMEGVPGALRVVRALLHDEDPLVRRAALRAAGASGMALAEEIVSALADPSSRGVALETAVRVGPPIVPLLAEHLGDDGCPRQIRLCIPRVLAQIGVVEGYQSLLSRLDERDEGLRQKILASASRMRRAKGLSPLEDRLIERRQSAELDALEQQFASHERTRRWLGMILLDRWILERLRKGLLRVLRLAELSADGGVRVERVRDAVFTSDVQRRARALEVLDDVLAPQLARRFGALIERWSTMRSALVTRPEGERPDGIERAIESLWDQPEPFAKVLALDAAQFRRLRMEPSIVDRSLRHREPAVRELAALVEVTLQREGWRARLAPLLQDDDETVRRYVQFAIDTGQTGMDAEDNMFTTLEKALFLQRVALFAEVAPEDLMGLARSAEVARHPRGTVLFRPGDPGRALHLVIDGAVSTRTQSGLVHTYREGEAFGELGALDGSTRSDEATVVEDATILEIAREDFVEVLRENGPLAEAVIRVLVERLRSLRT